jgi:predicted Rossmann fold flavoprotein
VSSSSRAEYDVLILGAGAAGLFCAIEAGRGGRRVLLLDHADRIGKKILVSGGGRANFTNLHATAANFLSANPHFAKSALSRYTPADFVALVEQHRIPWHEKALGQLFCDRSARDLVSMLEQEAAMAGVEIVLRAQVERVRHDIRDNVGHNRRFVLETSYGFWSARALVVATGGLSIPKLGATSLGYRIAEQFGLKIQPCRPALVPFTFAPEDLARFEGLAGISTEAVTSIEPQYFREKLLFTHRGLSGPAVLQISSYWRPCEPVLIDLAPEKTWTKPLRGKNARRDLAAARAALRAVLPQRLADRWLEIRAPQVWTNAALDEMEQALHCWTVSPAGTEGYEKAEVTAGGVDTAELSARTMESHRVPGLYFIGEVVDVTGQLGGYNFQWAWASGAAAGRALAESSQS